MTTMNDRGQQVWLTTEQQWQYHWECERRWAYRHQPRYLTQEQADRLQGLPNANRPSGWNYGRPESTR